MKKPLIILMFAASLNHLANADTCPPIRGLDPLKPPAGWTLLVPPVIAGETYYFGEAVHSLNGSFHYKNVICKYEACPTSFCPAFAILSDKQYELPNTRTPPWHYRSTISYTFTCRPADHDPSICVFQ